MTVMLVVDGTLSNCAEVVSAPSAEFQLPLSSLLIVCRSSAQKYHMPEVAPNIHMPRSLPSLLSS